MSKETEYVRFLEDIRERVEARYEGKVKGKICTSVRNNNVLLTGLLLKGEGEQVAPNFFLDQQFVEWMRGRSTLEEITTGVCKAYEREVNTNSHLVSEIKFEWEEFRRNVFLRLINREQNRELLKNIPYREFLDLAVVCYYSVPISEGVQGTLIVTKEHLELLHITEEELHQAAKSNCERFQPAKIRCMEEVVLELGRRLGVDVRQTICLHPCMYVLTNAKGMFGAVSLVFEEELENFSKRINNSFYVLPSSIHEVILVPDYGEFSVDYFSGMVREVNETQVEETEVLSDSIYYYDKEVKSIRRVA